MGSVTTAAFVRRFRGLYVLADPDYGAFTPGRLDAALKAGVCAVQYRDKRRKTTLVEVRRARALCREYQVPFLVNDDPHLARSLAADGVHLGRDDMHPAKARELLGDEAVIGVSCYDDLACARAAVTDGADYVAFGRFFPSRTKPDASACAPELLAAARAELTVPIVAIGGITPQNGGLLLRTGADVLAVTEGVFAAASIEEAVRQYASLFQER